jgi:signal peptidase I
MKQENKDRLRKAAHELRAIVFILVGVLAARSTLADHYHVPSGSMEPTLISGDRVFVDKLAHGLRIPFTDFRITEGDTVVRGEIVIFDSPHDGKRLIKRIVAVGGDDVVIQKGRLSINGEPMAHGGDWLTERFADRIVRLNLAHGGGPDFRQVVPPGKLLAVGDHRGNSADGRMFGLIDETEVYGRAIAVYYRRGDGFTWLNL